MGATGRVASSRAHGQWLQQQRRARGWSVPEMRRRLREAARQAGDNLPDNDCLTVMIYRWEDDRSGISERYRLHYCKAFQIPIEEFGRSLVVPRQPLGDHATAMALTATPLTATPLTATPPTATSPQITTSFLASAATRPGHRSNDEPGFGRSWIEQEILMTAHESNDHAQHAERRDAGEATLEQLRSDVVRLSHEYMTGQPLPLFFEMRRVRDQMYGALDRKLWPRDQSELYFLLGCVNSLMATAADGLGNSAAAEELARAGLAYALAIDHRPLAAQLRLGLAVIALYANQPLRSMDMATRGIEQLSDGPNGAQLRLVQARAAARIGDSETARQAIATATEIRERDYADELTEIGGEFGFSVASQHYYAGSAVAEMPGAESNAIAELGRAIELYAAGPEPGEHHSLFCKMIARVDLAGAWVRAGQLEAAVSVAGPVLALPPGQRISKLPKKFSRVRSALAAPRYQGSAEAREFDGQIEQFCRDTIAAHLRDLPASPT
jgi:hypothetical protein